MGRDTLPLCRLNIGQHALGCACSYICGLASAHSAAAGHAALQTPLPVMKLRSGLQHAVSSESTDVLHMPSQDPVWKCQDMLVFSIAPLSGIHVSNSSFMTARIPGSLYNRYIIRTHLVHTTDALHSQSCQAPLCFEDACV